MDGSHCEGAGVGLCDFPLHLRPHQFDGVQLAVANWQARSSEKCHSTGCPKFVPLEGNMKKIWANIGNS